MLCFKCVLCFWTLLPRYLGICEFMFKYIYIYMCVCVFSLITIHVFTIHGPLCSHGCLNIYKLIYIYLIEVYMRLQVTCLVSGLNPTCWKCFRCGVVENLIWKWCGSAWCCRDICLQIHCWTFFHSVSDGTHFNIFTFWIWLWCVKVLSFTRVVPFIFTFFFIEKHVYHVDAQQDCTYVCVHIFYRCFCYIMIIWLICFWLRLWRSP